MKILTNKNEVKQTNIQKIVHITFYPSFQDFKILIEKSPNLKSIQISDKKYDNYLSEKSKELLKLSDIEILFGACRNHKNLDGCVSIPADRIFQDWRFQKYNGCTDETICERYKISQPLLNFIIEEKLINKMKYTYGLSCLSLIDASTLQK